MLETCLVCLCLQTFVEQVLSTNSSSVHFHGGCHVHVIHLQNGKFDISGKVSKLEIYLLLPFD